MAQAPYNSHPIQLKSLHVLELSLIANRPPGNKSQENKPESFYFNASHSEYQEAQKTIAVKFEAGVDEEKNGNDEGDEALPYSIKVVVMGIFVVMDDEAFDTENISHWAGHNAPIILYPYVRENVYSLLTRAGYDPIVLPLLEVPTIRSRSVPE